MNINPGELDRRVTMYSPSKVADSFGQMVTTWAVVGTVWAKVKPAHGSETVAGGAHVEGKDMALIIRYIEAAASEWKVVYNGEDYRVTSVKELGRRQWQELNCKRIGEVESGQ